MVLTKARLLKHDFPVHGILPLEIDFFNLWVLWESRTGIARTVFREKKEPETLMFELMSILEKC